MRLAAIVPLLAAAACVPALPGGTLTDPATGGAGGSAGAPITGGGASTGGSAPATGGSVGPATGGSAVTGPAGTGGASAPSDQPLVYDGGRPPNIAVDANNVYWVNRRQQPFILTKVPIAGGTPVPLATVSAFYTWVAADEESVYWTDGANPTSATAVFKMPSAGGMPTNIASGPDTINRIAVGRDGVYWTTTAGTVMKIDRTGTATVLATGQGSTSELAVDTDSVCWVRVETRAIMKVGVSGGQPVELTITPNGPAMSLAVDATHVYWADQDNTVMWASLADGIPKRLFPTAGVTGLAVDASGVYWTDRAGFVVVGHPTSPAPPQAIAGGGRSTVFGVVLDATSVYWIGDGLGSIYRKPK